MRGQSATTVNPVNGSEVSTTVVARTVCVPSTAPGAMVVVMSTLVGDPALPIVAVTPIHGELPILTLGPERDLIWASTH